jgi:hypothetical protein
MEPIEFLFFSMCSFHCLTYDYISTVRSYKVQGGIGIVSASMFSFLFFLISRVNQASYSSRWRTLDSMSISHPALSLARTGELVVSRTPVTPFRGVLHPPAAAR